MIFPYVFGFPRVFPPSFSSPSRTLQSSRLAMLKWQIHQIPVLQQSFLHGHPRWLQPIWKIFSSNWIISISRGEQKKSLKPSPKSCWWFRNPKKHLGCITTHQPFFLYWSLPSSKSNLAFQAVQRQVLSLQPTWGGPMVRWHGTMVDVG